MSSNRSVVYLRPGRLMFKESTSYLPNPAGKKIDHGFILKVVATKSAVPTRHGARTRHRPGWSRSLITGEIIEMAAMSRYLGIGDLVSVPFNVAAAVAAPVARAIPASARRQPRARRRGLRLCRYGRLDRRPGCVRHGALRRLQLFEVSRQGPALEKIRDLTCLTDILPTGFMVRSRPRSASVRPCTSRARDRSVLPLPPRTLSGAAVA